MNAAPNAAYGINQDLADKEREIQEVLQRLRNLNEERDALKLKSTQLTANAVDLKRQLRQLTAQRDALEEEDEDDERSYNSVDEEEGLWSVAQTLLHPPSGSQKELKMLTDDSHLGSMAGNWPHSDPDVALQRFQSEGGATDDLESWNTNVSGLQTRCVYKCFRAGPPLASTIVNDMFTMGCHFWRSREIVNLSNGSFLASDSEKAFLEAELAWPPEKVNAQHSLINLMVWRRSVLLLLFLSSLGAFCFSVLGDSWSTFAHMKSMGQLSDFNISYDAWRGDAWDRLDDVSCRTIDAHFADVLESMRLHHEVRATNCFSLLRSGVSCGDTLDRAIDGCWEPGFCQESIAEHCPSACTRRPLCKDTRNSRRLDYTAFTLDFAKSILYKLMEQVSRAQLLKQSLSALFKLIACLLMLRAATFWADWKRSNRLVLWAWLITFCAPFLRSLIPTPRLVEWGPIQADLEKYLATTDSHFDLTPRMAQLAETAGLSCQGHKLESMVNQSWHKTHGKVRWVCGQINTASRWIPWSSMLTQGSHQCQVITDYMGIGDRATEEASIEKDKLCSAIRASHMKDPSLRGMQDILDVHWIKSAAYSLVGTLSSILSFQVVLPEALSVAPGFLTGAIRTKVVIPQSYLPGVFIVIMPLLYVPMAWAFCIFIVQGVGDMWLEVALTAIVFSPLAYTALGLLRRVSSPMSRNRVRAFTRHVQGLVNLMLLTGLVCILCYAYHIWRRIDHVERSRDGIAYFLLEQGKLMLPLIIGQVSFSITSLALSGPFWSFNFTFWTEMYMTAVVSADWMLRASAEEWHQQGEECLVDLKEQGHLDAKSVEAYHNHRVEAMSAMIELTNPPRRCERNVTIEPFTGH